MSGDLVAWVYRLDARASNSRRHLLLIGVSQSILSDHIVHRFLHRLPHALVASSLC